MTDLIISGEITSNCHHDLSAELLVARVEALATDAAVEAFGLMDALRAQEPRFRGFLP